MDKKKILKPEKYGMVVCKYCNGHGYIHYPKHQACPKCGGFGLIKKEPENVSGDKLDQ